MAGREDEAEVRSAEDGEERPRPEGGAEVAPEGEADAASAGGQEAEQAAQREAAEHAALVRVFEDVRRESRDSRLVTPARWAELGIVPEHLDPEAFEMMVYEYWEEHQDAEDAGDAAEGGAGASPAAVKGRGGASSRARSSSIPSVGVPPFLRREERVPGYEDAPEGESEGEGVEPSTGAPEGGFASGSGEGAVLQEGPVGMTAAETADDRAGAPSPAGAEASDSAAAPASGQAADGGPESGVPPEFASLRLPDGYKLAEVEGEWVLVPTDEDPAAERPIDCSGIRALVGAHSYYLYDRTGMSDAYAHWSFIAAEDDDVVIFAECVREESRVYPRPMPVDSLENEPYGFTRDRVERAWQAAHDSGDYPDIERTEASNGDVYFYSTRYLSRTLAESLAEWDAVERKYSV